MALYVAVEKNNAEIVKLLLTKENINVNFLNIMIFFFNAIINDIFQIHSKLCYSIQFKNIFQ